ncbi:Polycystic kidney disease protein 1-like 2 [Mizuhopecten yessoensis]|uniref:Polycystic kidney disease protein 1-like 2 n=1 Tax=Mizuhopecten yessoensis TaxID=6573 RepID=A0A210QST8_MIZYE|nr:Polycystic kidney disease protein 1-like 2 [Mizuhopecten yessoensis]
MFFPTGTIAPNTYQWASWSSWSNCENEASGITPCYGRKNRTRFCFWDSNYVAPNQTCVGDCVDIFSPNCSCTPFDEFAVQDDALCIDGGSSVGEKEVSCPLPVDGGWSDWTNTSCSVTCGSGSYQTVRDCDKPSPCNGGLACAGNSSFTFPCQQVLIDGDWSEWGNYSRCSVSIGTGTKIRERACDHPPTCGGAYCTGESNQTMECEVLPTCFSNNVLDPLYSSMDTPMSIYIGANIDIYSIVQIYRDGVCEDIHIHPRYEWNVYNIDLISGNVTHILHVGEPNIPFDASELGLYKVVLRVYYNRHSPIWLEDEMYISVSYPPPNAAIVGGSVRMLGVGVNVIDGLTLSYDMSKGPGYTATLQLDWVCTLIAIGSIYDTLNVDINEEILFPDEISQQPWLNHSFVLNRIDDLVLAVDNLMFITYFNTNPPKEDFCNMTANGNFTDEFIQFDSQVIRFDDMYADLINLIEIINEKVNYFNDFITFTDYAVSSSSLPTIKTEVQSWVNTVQNELTHLTSLRFIINTVKTYIPESDGGNYSKICEKPRSSYTAFIGHLVDAPVQIEALSLTDWNALALEEELLRNTTATYLQQQSCSNFRETSNGYARLEISDSDVSDSLGFIISLRVSANQSFSYFQQRIQSVPGNPPAIDISCRLNCLPKTASSSILSLRAECSSCTYAELATISYSWNVSRFNTATKARTELPDWQSRLESEFNSPAFVLNPQTLSADSSYIIELNITLYENSSSLTLLIINTNIPPYGGKNEIHPGHGRAGVTQFTIKFSGWKDEGYRKTRNPDIDWKESIFYRVLTRKGSEVPTLLYHGVERKVSVYLPEGNSTNLYQLEILLRIYDIFGDFSEFTSIVTSSAPISNVTVSAVTSYVDTVDGNIDSAIGSGNLKLVTMSVENAASTINTLDFPESSVPEDMGSLVVLPTSVENSTSYNWDVLWADYINPPFNSAQENLSVVTEQYSSILHSTSLAEQGAGMVTVKHLAQGVGSVINDPTLIDEEVVNTAVTTNELILTMFQNTTVGDKYPLFADYETTSESILRVADNALNSIITTRTPNNPISTDLYDIQQTIVANNDFIDSNQDTEPGDMSTMERAFLASQISKSQALKKNETDEKAQKFVPDIIDSLSSLGKVLKGMVHMKQLPVLINRPGLSTSMSAMTLPELMANPIERNNITMEFSQSQDQSVDTKDIQITVFDKNPFTWDPEAQYITSNVLSVSIKDNAEEEVNVSVKVRFPNIGDNNPKSVYLAFPADTNEASSQFFSYKFFWQFPADDMALRLEGVTHGMKFVVYLKGGSGATRSAYDWRYEVPDSDLNDNFFVVVVPGGLFQQQTTVYFTVTVDSVPDDSVSRKRRSIDNTTASSNSTIPATRVLTYDMVVWTAGCRVWNTAEAKWDKTSCQMSAESTALETVCICEDPPGQHFATSFYVPPNSIDFDSVFGKFDIVSNGAVLGTVVGVIILYVAVAVWAWRRDRRDHEMWALSYMSDNQIDDDYIYLVTVHTGLARNAGTSSRVYMAVTSNRRSSGIRALEDGTNNGFGTGSVRKFVMCMPKRLGSLICLDIWHDNSGKGNAASWLLSKVEIMDLQSMERFTFVCNRWLSLDEEDGSTQCALPVSDKEDLDSFGYHFRDNSRHSTTDGHLWLSIFIRPEDSNFTRVQRLSCCLALLFLAMIASAMFYKTDSGQNQVAFGPLKFSLTSLYISFMSIVISAIPVFLISILFQKSKKKSIIEEMDKKTITKFANLPDIAQVDEYSRRKSIGDEKVFMLPYWCVYVAWGLAVCSVLMSGFFVMLYSMEWGKTKSEEWLLCFLLSFVESILITDPIKVITVAFLISYFFRKQSVNSKAELDIQNVLEEAKKRAAVPKDNTSSVKVEYPTSQLGRECVEKMKEQRQKELKAKMVFLELFCYVLFISVLYLISYSNRDSRSYQFRSHLENHLLKSPKSNSSSDTLRFSNIVKTEDFYTWMEDTLLPFVFPTLSYSGTKLTLSEKSNLRDNQNYRIGPLRLRQLRVNAGRCPFPLMGYQTCYKGYEIADEDDQDYCIGWTDGPCPTNEILRLSSSAWKFTSATDLWGVPLLGDYSLYGGGGYVADMGVNYDVSFQTLQELKTNFWLDRRTRGVMVEFTLYNSNINLFAYLSLLVEFPDTGGTSQYNFVQIFRAYQHHGSLGTFIFLCEILFVISIVICFVKMVRSLMKQKLKVFEDRWQILNWICLGLTVVAIAMYCARWIFTSLTLDAFTKNKYKFVNFSHIAVWDEILAAFISVMVFLCTVRMMQILNYSNRITQLAAVLNHCSKDLFACAVMFGIVFFAYVSVGYLLFGRVLSTYRNILISMTTITNALIGRNSITNLIEVTPVFAQFYYVTFVFFVMWVLMTMINATLNKSISIIRQQQCQDAVPFGIHDLAMVMLKEFTAVIKSNHSTKNAVNENELSNDTNPSATTEQHVNSPFTEELLEYDLDIENKHDEDPEHGNDSIVFCSDSPQNTAV